MESTSEVPLPYIDAALICITLFCDGCGATLGPDEDLGPDVSFETDRWHELLGAEACRRGWQINFTKDSIEVRCPKWHSN